MAGTKLLEMIRLPMRAIINNRPTSDLDSIVYQGELAGVANDDQLVLNMYFVEVVPGFDDTGESYVNGLAFLGYNGIAMHVGDNMVSRDSRAQVPSRGSLHTRLPTTLGWITSVTPNNLMAYGTELTDDQIDIMRSSFYTVPV